MKVISQYITETKTRFEQIDSTIAELEKRIGEFAEQAEAEGDDYSPEGIALAAALHTELKQASEALAYAKNKRQEMSRELSANIYAELTPVVGTYIKEIREKNAKRVEEIWGKATELRRLVWEIGEAGDEARGEIGTALAELGPYYENKIIGSSGVGVPEVVIPPYLSHDGANGKLIRFIAKELRSYSREFQESEDDDNA